MILEPVCAEFFAAIKFDGTRHPQAATGKTTQRSVIASLWFCRATRYVTQLPLKVLFKRRGRREYFGAKSLGMYLLLGILFTTLFYIPAQANQTQKVNAALNTEKKMRVLVLHSYHHGFTWSDNISAGIRSTFASHRDQVELLFEFMDVRRIHSDEYFNRLIDLYALKYGQKDLDAIICADDHALGFVLGRGRDLFRKVPIVFCSVSGYQSAMHSGREVTGLLDSIDIKSTLETALKLHPATENVFVVSDMTRTGRALKGAAEKIFKDFEPQVRFTYFEDMTIEDLSDRVAGLPDNSIVFLFIFNRDRAGRVFSHEQNLNILAKHCSVPIYSVWKFYLGHGIVGGKLTSGETEGKMAAEITLDILDGRKASDIPPVKSPSQYMFDHEVLDRYNVDRDLLPQGSLVINQPYSFYTEYKKWVWGIAAVVSLLITIIAGLVGNIALRHRAEASLRESKEKFAKAFTLGPDSILITRVSDSVIVDANERFSQTTGYERREYIGKRADELNLWQDPEDKDRLVAIMMQTGVVDNFETVFRRRDGETAPYLISARFIEVDGEDCLISNARNIRDRKQAEDALRESEERYRSILDTVPDAISISRIADGRFVQVNKAFSFGTGFKREEAIGKTPIELNQIVDPDDRDRYISLLVEKGEVTDFELLLRKKDGSFRNCLLSARKIAYASEDCLVSVVRDITDLKLSGEALRESEEKYRNILENIEEGYYESDLAGNFTFANDSMAAILGYPKEDLVGLNNRDYLEADNADKVYRLFNSVYRSGKSSVYTGPLVLQNGSEIHVEASIGLMRTEDNKAIGFRGVFRDVTPRIQTEEEKKRLQSQLQQAQKMEAIGTLAGGIAHDFNNLLMGIQGRASLMMYGIDSNSEHQEHLKGIEAYIKRAADLTRQLLGFARGGKYEVSTADPNELIENSASMFGRTKKEIVVHKHFQKDIWAIAVDRSQLDQVFLNLFVNAWQAMPGGGNLYLQTQNIMLTEEEVLPFEFTPGRYVKFSITDTGIGMDEATRERIFEPFFTTKEMGRGTGLGLASAYGIVKNHEGIIKVYSEPGQGTTFTIYLPAIQGSENKKQEPVKKIQRGEGTILLVDDEDMILDIGRQLLQKLGYHTLSAAGGADAIDLYNAHKDDIGLVILDMIMPEMSGAETFEKLKAIDTGVKVLLSSGYSINDQAARILAQGCDGFIQKPFNIEQLSGKISEILCFG